MQKHIPIACPVFTGNEKKYVMDCIETGWISSIGKFIQEFEKNFSDFCNTKHAISCSNGTVALHLALLAYDVGPGDEIIVPTLTYVATANAVTYCGARPVFIDCEPETWNIDPDRIEEKITAKTKGIIIVHLYGHPANVDAIFEIARRHNLFVIEDAAEAHGALYKNRIVGSIGDIGTFSFFGNKIITSGEGGMVVTNSDELSEKIRLLKGQGMDPERRYWFPAIGYNYRMTNIQAAIGLAQLENISWHLDKRKEIANLYYMHLRELYDYIELPKEKEWARHSFWMFSILLKDFTKVSRDDFMQLLGKDGIETRPVFYPMHVMPLYRESNENFPVATRIASRGLNLPTHALLTEEDINYIAARIKKHCRSHVA
jgi:perosamine synthetase